jgi:hypothetical protein
MSQILIDGITNVAFGNGVVRIDCVMAGPNNEMRPSGTLLIPGQQAGLIINRLVKAMQELQRKQQEQTPSQAN